ncbi:DUF6036 family nucleotidyltransferase [Myxococcota bacterium]|nr:DUF6036 family nucleotidyltransferase [Myxococcota bacterium]
MPLLHTPQTLLTRDAKRIQRFLIAVERELLSRHDADFLASQNLKVVVYGSCAVSLYLGDEAGESDVSMTDDIDIAVSSGAKLLQECSPQISPPLEIRQSQVENWLIHPDWEDRIFDATSLLGLSFFHVFLLHPLDLILTKLGRYSERDAEDCIRLNSRYINDFSFFLAILDEALDFFVEHAPKKDAIRKYALLDLYNEAP